MGTDCTNDRSGTRARRPAVTPDMRLLAVLLTAVLVLTGCGDDDEPVAAGGSSTTAAPATVPAEGDEQARGGCGADELLGA